MRICVLVFVAACGGIPGDPETYVVDGTPKAGYAWSGPGSYCGVGDAPTENAAWQIWFTNTDVCPSSVDQIIAELVITTPEQVTRPNTQLPKLDPATPLQIFDFCGQQITIAEAALVSTDTHSAQGTLTLTSYSTEEITGTFTAMADTFDGMKLVELRGTFDAHRCSRIHE